ncbi:PGF-CTERM sorting domain-containing protein [Halorutilales archaeon Cl-col2-1]
MSRKTALVTVGLLVASLAFAGAAGAKTTGAGVSNGVLPQQDNTTENLVDQLQELNRTLNQLQDENERLRNQTQELSQRNDELEQRLNNVTTQNDQLRGELESERERNQELQSELNNTTSNGGGSPLPGFGPVVALVALVGAGLYSVARRQTQK